MITLNLELTRFNVGDLLKIDYKFTYAIGLVFAVEEHKASIIYWIELRHIESSEWGDRTSCVSVTHSEINNVEASHWTKIKSLDLDDE